MTSRHADRRPLGWTLLFALALLLKAAVPLLAVAAADAQGKAIFEVCSAYGVRTVVADQAPAAPGHPADAGAHGGDHCVLSSLLLLGGSAPAAADLPARAAAFETAAPAAARTPHDASSRWLAGLKHAPPAAA